MNRDCFVQLYTFLINHNNIMFEFAVAFLFRMTVFNFSQLRLNMFLMLLKISNTLNHSTIAVSINFISYHH